MKRPYRNVEYSLPKVPPTVEIKISKGYQSITLTPEEFAQVQRRMENAFIDSLVVLEE